MAVRHTRRLATGALALVAAVGLVGCGADQSAGGGTTPGSSVKLAFFAAGLANSYSQAQVEGAEAAAKELGATVKVFDGNFDAATQTSQLQSALASGEFDAVMMNAIGTEQVTQYIAQAAEADVPVVCVMNNCGSDLSSLDPGVEGQTAFVGWSVGGQGELLANQAVAACEGKDPCRVVIVQGLSVLASDVERTKAMKKVLATHPTVEVVATQDGGLDQQVAHDVAQNALSANREADVFVVTGDQMALGVRRAIDESGRSAGIQIISVGASEEGLKMLEAGDLISTVALLPRTEGFEGARVAIRAAKDEDFDPSIDVTELSPVGPVVTSENAARFKPEWAG